MTRYFFASSYAHLALALARILEHAAPTKANRAAAHDLRIYAIDMLRALELERLCMTYEEHTLFCFYWFGKDGPRLSREAALARVFGPESATKLRCSALQRLVGEAQDLGDFDEAREHYRELDELVPPHHQNAEATT